MTTTGREAIAIGAAEAGDLPACLGLLAEAGLPVAGLDDRRHAWLVARDGARVVGMVGCESDGAAGLLRSLAVARTHRSGGVATRLCRALMRDAARRGLRRLFLLTTDAAGFFARLGFAGCDRALARAALPGSAQLVSETCSSAACMTVDLDAAVALQHRFPGNHCFGCGPDNPRGLRLESYRVGGVCRAAFRPAAEHNAGPAVWLNGGVIATIVDCHAVFAALADAYDRAGRPVGSEPLLWYATGSLAIRYLRPARIDTEVQLEARVRPPGERRTTVECWLWSGGVLCATAEVVAVPVSERWRRGEGHGSSVGTGTGGRG